jgi:hypothetical protein
VKTWQKILIPTLITVAIGGIYLFFVWMQRRDPGAVAQNPNQQKLSADDVAIVRTEFQQHFEDTLSLAGASVWMKNGYTMPYYPMRGSTIVFHRTGLIPAAQRLDIKKIIKSIAPPTEDDRMAHGARQVFAVFAFPGKSDLYATPIGAIQGSGEAYFCDILFYYDDPHTIYDNWPKDVWTAIDAHQAKPGMSELETRMSIGSNVQPDGQTEGDRTVTYDQAGKQWTVTYVNNHATTIQSNSPAAQPAAQGKP